MKERKIATELTKQAFRTLTAVEKSADLIVLVVGAPVRKLHELRRRGDSYGDYDGYAAKEPRPNKE